MPNLDATSRPLTLQNAANLIATVANQAIARATGAQSALNMGAYGFLFDIIGDESIEAENRITDHYAEDNKSIQDHIAQGPERFALQGYIGEVTDILTQGLQAIITSVDRLGLLDEFLPNFTEQATQYYGAIASTIGKVTQIVAEVQNAYDLFTQRSTTATKQQAAYNYFRSMMYSNQPFTLETPFGIFENMYIESMRAKQNDHSKYISDFRIIFKKIRTVQDAIFIANLSEISAGKLKQETQPNADQGTQSVSADPSITISPSALSQRFT